MKTQRENKKIILELYDKFFRNAFPRLTERLGIVYTPVEAVDFIIHSVNDILKQEFGITIGSEQVQVLDPFTGTGTFITRLMQSGLLTREELIKKYKTSIHANEIVLLAYYIAAINIESTYHDMVGQASLPVPVIPKKSDDIGVETGDIEVKTGEYGNLTAAATQKWGYEVSAEIVETPRALWSPHPPAWMVITFFILMGAVWIHYAIVIYNLFKIRSHGRHASGKA